MNLSPEERAIGKENFNAAIGSELTRREFLERSVAAAAVTGVGLGGFYFGYEKLKGDPVRVGVIGTGDEGSVLIGAHARLFEHRRHLGHSAVQRASRLPRRPVERQHPRGAAGPDGQVWLEE